MINREPTRTTNRRISEVLTASLLVIIAAIAVALGSPMLASSSSTATSPINVISSEYSGAALAIGPDAPYAEGPRERVSTPTHGPDPIRPLAGSVAPGGTDPGDRPRRGALGVAGGVVPDGTTVFDDEIPGVANLDPALLGALRQAATDAADDGVEFYVNSGWRSPAYQNQLLREAISTYGSEEEATRWVATADTSPHVSGNAVDIGLLDAILWLSNQGAKYGLCQIYSNESWHYELRPEAIEHGCPPMYVDPTHDPRMQQ